MDIQNTVSVFIESQFPNVFLTDGELLVAFIKYYYQWMESYENPIYVARKIHEYRDVDKIPEKFYTFLREEFLKNVPTKHITDEATLLKNIKDFYRAKGSEKAFRLLFRILYNEEIEFYYPGRDILRASAGRWVINKTLKVELRVSDEELSGVCLVYGSSGTGSDRARARITKSISYLSNNVQVTEIYLSDIRGTFSQDEELLCGLTDEVLGIIISNGLITYDGYYDGTDGFLSWDKKLQDNYYYQEYSYVIKSGIEFTKYKPIVQTLIHPAGTLMFGQVFIELPFGYDSEVIVSEIESVLIQKYDLEYIIDANAYFETVFSFTDTSTGQYVIEVQIDAKIYEPKSLSNDYQFANTATRVFHSNTISHYEDIPISHIANVNITDLDQRIIMYAREDSWEFSNVSSITSFDKSPLDNQTLRKYLTTANSANQTIYTSNSNIYSNTEYKISVYAKESSLSSVYFNIPSVGTADFNVNTVVSNSSIGNATIIAANNNFYYCEWLVRPTTNSYFSITLNSSSANTESIYLWDLDITMRSSTEAFTANQSFYTSLKRNIPSRHLYDVSENFDTLATGERIEIYSYDNNKSITRKIEEKISNYAVKLQTPIPYEYANNMIIKELVYPSGETDAKIEAVYTDIYEETQAGVVLVSNSVGAYTPSLITSVANSYIYARRVLEGNNTIFDAYLPAGSIVKILDSSNTLVIVQENISNNIIILRDSYSNTTNTSNKQYKYISI